MLVCSHASPIIVYEQMENKKSMELGMNVIALVSTNVVIFILLLLLLLLLWSLLLLLLLLLLTGYHYARAGKLHGVVKALVSRSHSAAKVVQIDTDS